MTSECQTSTIKESTIRMLQTGNILNRILCRHTLIFKYILKYISEMCPLHLSHRKWVVDSWCGTFWKSSFCSLLGFSVNIFDVLRSRNSCIAHTYTYICKYWFCANFQCERKVQKLCRKFWIFHPASSSYFQLFIYAWSVTICMANMKLTLTHVSCQKYHYNNS